MTDFQHGTQAVIFDLDGVIADTEPLHKAAFARLLQGLGIDSLGIADWGRFVGTTDRTVLLELIRGREVDGTPEELLERKAGFFLELVREQAPLFPEVPGLVAALAVHYRLAVASGSLRTAIAGVLALGELWRFFGPTLSVQDVERGKPAPDLFLRAAELMGVPPSACVVIEDSVPGVAAARAAGMRVIGITTTNPAERIADADAVVDTFAAISALLLPRVVAGG